MRERLRVLRFTLRLLRDYEGRLRATLRAGAAGVVWLFVRLLPIAAGVAGVLLPGGKPDVGAAILGVCVALAGAAASRRLIERDVAWDLVAVPLQRHSTRTGRHVAALLPEDELESARRALRRAGFAPDSGATRLPVAPEGAAHLTAKLMVHDDPAADGESDAAWSARVHRALDLASLTARIGGTDTASSRRRIGAAVTSDATPPRPEPLDSSPRIR